MDSDAHPSLTGGLLGAAEIRALASSADIRPTKTLGQNFLHDANTVRRIVRTAGLDAVDVVLEIGPGLGSLTLGLLEVAARVVAVEIDPVLAGLLPSIVEGRGAGERLTVIGGDALRLHSVPDPQPTALVANLPYNVAVPVVLHLLEAFPGLRHGLVLVQAEVAQRLAAGPGTKIYGIPSVKAAWYGRMSVAGSVSRAVFWPVPNVDSSLVRFVRHPPPTLPSGVVRTDVFSVIDAALAQRRKTLRAALAGWAGSPARAEAALVAAGVSPQARGETLGIAEFVAIAAHHPT